MSNREELSDGYVVGQQKPPHDDKFFVTGPGDFYANTESFSCSNSVATELNDLRRKLQRMTDERDRAIEELDGIHSRARAIQKGLREFTSADAGEGK